jgi:hypothetical protein
MSPEDFECEVRLATTMRDESSDAPYWSGYRRGLLRARFGRRFSTNTDHVAWLEFRNSDDPLIASLGRGYTDGVQTVLTGSPQHDVARARPPKKFLRQFAND